MPSLIVARDHAMENHPQTMFDWVVIPGGPAEIGGDRPGDRHRQTVHLPGFYMSRFAVTNRQFQRFMIEGGYIRDEFWEPSAFEWITQNGITEPAFWRDDNFNRPQQPVTGVCFFEVQAFAQWTGCRIPAEDEWEKAAGGADGHCYPWGCEEPDMERAKFAPDFCPTSSSTDDVEGYPNGESPYGCRGMAGNIFEWCIDRAEGSSSVRQPRSALAKGSLAERRVLKGGAWTTGADRLRVAARWFAPSGLRDNIVGVRLVHAEPAMFSSR